MSDDYGFHFEPAGRSGSQGAIDAAQEHFEGSTAQASVVRETGQNSLDHPADGSDGPIRMEFEIATLATADIPGIDGLRDHLRWVERETRRQQGHGRMRRAAELAEEDEVRVLRISDYGTTGLTGSESVDSPSSPLSALTRGTGTSDDDGARGGSFGIGSAVGPMASDMSTVLYVSRPQDEDTTVFAGYSRLASHRDDDGEWHRGDGYFTRLDAEDFDYLRPAPRLGSFPTRAEPGTDIYILGFRMAEDDPDLTHIRDAAVDNFMAAILHGRLVVTGIHHGDQSWTLDDTSLSDHVRGRTEAAAFLQALQDPTPTIEKVDGVGQVKLYVNIDNSLDSKLHTITMRKPLMRIDEFKHHSITVPYAAVLVCDDDEGNRVLRRLEPPRHDEWDPGRDPVNGRRIVSSLKTFVRAALRDRVDEKLGDTVEIKGLARYLPAPTVAGGPSGTPAVPGTEPGGSEQESSTVTGDPDADATEPVTTRRKVTVKVRKPAVADEGDEVIEKGKDRGGEGERSDDGEPRLPGKGSEAEEGRSRIARGDIRFRSWNDPSSPGTTLLAVTARHDVAGDLQLVPLGPGGTAEDGYVLPIESASLETAVGPQTIDVDGNTLCGLDLTGGATTRIRLRVPEGVRYRLEVAP